MELEQKLQEQEQKVFGHLDLHRDQALAHWVFERPNLSSDHLAGSMYNHTP